MIDAPERLPRSPGFVLSIVLSRAKGPPKGSRLAAYRPRNAKLELGGPRPAICDRLPLA